tara:strand:+ start:2098 stop:2358 length:261 start_codon:yes stop_codon:yes gene_type:complete
MRHKHLTASLKRVLEDNTRFINFIFPSGFHQALGQRSDHLFPEASYGWLHSSHQKALGLLESLRKADAAIQPNRWVNKGNQVNSRW